LLFRLLLCWRLALVLLDFEQLLAFLWLLLGFEQVLAFLWLLLERRRRQPAFNG
jgi:hypothetical protein